MARAGLPTLALLAAALVSCPRGGGGGAPVAREVPAEIARAPRTTGVAHTKTFRVCAEARPDAKAVRLEWQLADPTTPGVVQRLRDLSVDFVPSATSRTANVPSTSLWVAGRDPAGDVVVERWTPGSPLLVDGRDGPAAFPDGGPKVERREVFRRATDAWITDLWPTPRGGDVFLARTWDPATGVRALVLAEGGAEWKELYDSSALEVLGEDPYLLGTGDHVEAGHVHLFVNADRSTSWVLVDPTRAGGDHEVDVVRGGAPAPHFFAAASYR